MKLIVPAQPGPASQQCVRVPVVCACAGECASCIMPDLLDCVHDITISATFFNN